MTAAATPVRKRTWDADPAKPAEMRRFIASVGELARDLDIFLSALPLFALLEFTATYAEPLYVAFDHNPKGIVCVRVRKAGTVETPVLSGGISHWVWEGTRARINSIDGLTPDGSQYIFTFLMVG